MKDLMNCRDCGEIFEIEVKLGGNYALSRYLMCNSCRAHRKAESAKRLLSVIFTDGECKSSE